VKDFFDWYRERGFTAAERWLILGKGPSYSRLADLDHRGMRLLSLNHVVRERPVDVAHIVDVDVVDACGEALVANAGVVVMPWIPHVNQLAGEQTLEEVAAAHPILARLDREGRLLWYNLSTGRRRQRRGSPIVRVRYFSAEAALNLLALAGAREIRTLGVDGGASYSASFTDLEDTTLLANKRTSFDQQFDEFARTIRTSGITFGPLDLEVPARVYVGTTEEQMLAVEVLEYSIRKHASLSVEVHPLHRAASEAAIEVPLPADPANRPRTPFSFHRFLIPALAGRRGRALYLDSDMQVFEDLRALWSLPFDGADLLSVREPESSGRASQFSVMLLDCGALDWDIRRIVADLDAGRMSYEQLMGEMRPARAIRAGIDPAWNSLERYEEGVTALLHYTDMPTQPWVHAEHPLGHLWVRDLMDAIEDGFIGRAEVEEHVERGWVRPTLLHQIDKREPDAAKLPARLRADDDGYEAPYRRIAGHRPRRRHRAPIWRQLTRLFR
jgi:hypothetical protein